VRIELTEDQLLIQQTTRDFARNELRPFAAEWDEGAQFPAAAVAKLGELGLMGVAVPAEWGGAGLDLVAYTVAVEEISWGCASTGVILSVNNSLYCDPLLRYGTEAQKKEWLTPFARGEQLGCFALSEPGSGSDAAAMKAVAVRRGDVYLLNGTKNFITNAPDAQACVLLAMTDLQAGHKGISAFILPMDLRGVSLGRPEHKLGIRASSTTSIILEDAELPASNLLGKEGEGFKVAMSTLDGGRIGIAAQALGIARAAIEDAGLYAQTRQAFGSPIADLQAIRFMLAESATELEAARLLTRRAAWLKDQKLPYSTESAIAKLYASEAASRIANRGIQIFGGYGYLQDYPAERHWRDARITEIYEGTSEIQRLVIARAMLRG
jgi:butyryl-CoA dehydrogenase